MWSLPILIHFSDEVSDNKCDLFLYCITKYINTWNTGITQQTNIQNKKGMILQNHTPIKDPL